MSKKGRQNVINKPLEKEFGVYDASAVFIGAYIVMLLLQFLFYIKESVLRILRHDHVISVIGSKFNSFLKSSRRSFNRGKASACRA